MVFVVSVLEKQLGLDSSSAISTMMKIHTTGGAPISMQTREESERVASEIVSLAKDRGHPLSCKAVTLEK
jgi:ATP-dependent Clp protease adapter protein ClpS